MPCPMSLLLGSVPPIHEQDLTVGHAELWLLSHPCLPWGLWDKSLCPPQPPCCNSSHPELMWDRLWMLLCCWGTHPLLFVPWGEGTVGFQAPGTMQCPRA